MHERTRANLAAFKRLADRWEEHPFEKIERELEAQRGIITAYEHLHHGEMHWEGCEQEHPVCAAYIPFLKLIEEFEKEHTE